MELIYSQIQEHFGINVDDPSTSATPTASGANKGEHDDVDDI